MSELQISLLVIGVVVVVLVYGYGAWQQWQYRRKYGASFQSSHEDVLQTSDSVALPPSMETASLKPELAAETDSACAQIDDRFDFVILMSLQAPLPSGALESFWKVRFDFGKTVTACGLNAANGRWERLIPDSPPLYSEFRLALQLADRSGVISDIRLQEFRACLSEIAMKLLARLDMPDIDATLDKARQLDAFCASVDQMVGLNLLPNAERPLFGSEVARVAQARGFSLQADGNFHWMEGDGTTVFRLCDMESRPFQLHVLNQMRVSGLTVLLDVPRVDNPSARFGQMAELAQALAADFRAMLVDDHRVALGEGALMQIRAQIADIENKMSAGGVPPGGAQALRLFA